MASRHPCFRILLAFAVTAILPPDRAARAAAPPAVTPDAGESASGGAPEGAAPAMEGPDSPRRTTKKRRRRTSAPVASPPPRMEAPDPTPEAKAKPRPKRKRVQLAEEQKIKEEGETAGAATAAARMISGKLPSDEADETAVVESFHGFVESKPAGQAMWIELTKPGLGLKPQDRLHTYLDADAVVAFHEESRVAVSQFSIFSIEKNKFDHIAVGVFQGKVIAKVSWRANRKFEVRAPGAAVVARASEQFTVAATSDKRVRVEVESGEVSVYVAGGKQVVKAREAVEVVRGRLGPVEAFGPAFTAPPPEERAAQAPAQDLAVPDRDAKAKPRADEEEPAPVEPPVGYFKAMVERETRRAIERDAVESAAPFAIRTDQYREGKVLTDSHGARVRVEEYLTRPDARTFKIIAMNRRESALAYSTLQVEANKTLPDELSDAGNLFYSPVAAKPNWWAAKYWWTQSNGLDSVAQIGVDGESLAVSISPEPVYDQTTGGFISPTVGSFYQTFFGNVYQFLNGGSDGLARIYSDAAFRPADNGLLLGTGVAGMVARLQPIEVRVRDVLVPATVLATYYDYAFVSSNPGDLSGNATGKADVVDVRMPIPYLARFLEMHQYLNFVDTNRNGILDFSEAAEANTNCRYGNCPVANVFHDRMNRRDGANVVALPGAGCQGTDAGCGANAGDTTFFSDTSNDSVKDAGEPQLLGVTGPKDPNLLAFAAANRRAWLETETFAADDFADAVRLPKPGITGGSSGDYSYTDEIYESRIALRTIGSSAFSGRVIRLTLIPSFYMAAGLLDAETADGRCPGPGSRPIPW